MFQSHQPRNVISACAHQISGLAHQFGTIIGRDLLPDRKAFLGSGKRFIQIGLFGMGDSADHFLIGRVQHIDGLATARGAPFAIHVQLDIGVGHAGFLQISLL